MRVAFPHAKAKATASREDYRLISLVKVDVKLLNKTLQNEFNNTLEGQSIVIKWDFT